MRFRNMVRGIGHELRLIGQMSRSGGARQAAVARTREILALDVEASRLAAIESSQAAIGTRLAPIESSQAAIESSQAAIESSQAAIDSRLAVIESRQAALEAHIRNVEAAHRSRIDEIQEGLNTVAVAVVPIPEIDRRVEHAAHLSLIDGVTAWVRGARVKDDLKISVVLPTFNRQELLPRAIESVIAQEYGNWELIVVDDGSDDQTPELLEGFSAGDQRIVAISLPHRGVAWARNVALARATGDVVCYLDDDNTMEPLWLKAVSWAFQRQPDLHVLYGARVRDLDHPDDRSSFTVPLLDFERFDREKIESGNYIDLGVMAHRRDHPEARFDESLPACGDWDLLLRLTVDRPPLALPVVASMYATSAPNRISGSGRSATAVAMVHARLRRARPLRVLGYNSMYPVVTETYIGQEMRALTDNGAELAWCTEIPASSPISLTETTFTDLDAAVGSFDPEVLVLYWTTFALSSLDRLSRVGRPFALRVHSFDFDLEHIERVRSHPMCVGIWAYPHHARQIEGAYELMPLLTNAAEFAPPADERPIVLSMSAALPKRDWPTLLRAFGELTHKGVDCRIVVGVTPGFEGEPARLRQLIRDEGAPIKLSIDLPNDLIVAMLARTAAVVYTKVSEGPFGMPRSIIEGMFAKTSTVLPAGPEAQLVAGPTCRTYERPEGIVSHVTEILAGGPAVDAEREANHAFAASHFADPALATAFYDQLANAARRHQSG